ncbi:methyl-accepting chemotaxis protein 4 [Paraliobacillus ryukyuensis]|uniref:Methyl-accepting chemotaxis protein n=1 Tax=Paraliobacillus ryukyuensis TaxID=200904 RepID=A0A366DTU2_9BACI|nr:HAMP domain-containing methyl-accepting chemotaxis protein [Paraliobacillus ryukyuensis]RBO93507.1 methyl-accepting chemotaxis protein [Paraliobacillus ryukyuensis]
MKKSSTIPFWNKIQFRIIITLIIVLLFNSTITSLILNLINMTGLNLGAIGIWLNNFLNVIITTIIIGLFLHYYVIRPIKKMEQTIQAFENGESDVHINTTANNELGVLGERLNHLFENIVSFHHNQQQQIQLVEDKSSSISDRINQMTNDIASLQQHFETITASSQEQLSAFEETSAVVDNMNGQFQSIASDFDEITTSFHHMRSKTEDGVSRINDSSKMMLDIAKRSEETKNNIVELAEEVGKINEVVTLINDISEQTNLLALNASIEAARAGEHGKGFSIVAEEVRKLAERSVSATEQIRQTVEHILHDVDQIAKQSEDRANNINEESNKILAINESFEEITSNIVSNIDLVEKMNEHTQTFTKSSDEISTTMDHVTSKTEQTTERMVELNNTVTAALEDMKDVNTELNALNESFQKIN